MLSSGLINLGKLIGGWSLAVAVTAFTIVNFEEIRTTLGLKLNPEDFGVVASAERTEASPSSDEVEERQRAAEARAAERDRERPRQARREEPLFSQSVHLTRGRDGHFHAEASINGRTIPVLVDTGATLVALSYEDAQAAGISVSAGDFRYVSSTANGEARFAKVTLDHVRIGNVSVHNVAAAVGQPGKLSTTLLGMSFLGQLRMEMKNGVLVLEQ